MDTLFDSGRADLIRDFLDQLPEPITLASAPDVTVVHVNRMGREFLRKTLSELRLPLGEHVAALEMTRPDGAVPKDADLPLVRAIKLGEHVRGEEFNIRTGDGIPKVILCNASPIRNNQGDIIAAAVAWRDITELKHIQVELARLSDERDLLLRELSHRTMNTISMLKSVIDLQKNRIKRGQGPVDVLETVSRRVAAVGALYNYLHHSGSAHLIEISEFLPAIGAELKQSIFDMDRGDILSLTADRCVVDSDAATAIALIVNELVTNACMHGYDGDQRRHVSVEFRCADAESILTVTDDGCGFPETFLPSKDASGLGMKVVLGMAQKVGGKVSAERKDGLTVFTVRWPERGLRARRTRSPDAENF